MIKTIEIKDFYGRILGKIEEDSNTGIQTARDFYGKIMGKYDPRDDTTRDFYGKILYRGNMVRSLIPSWEELH